MGKRNQKTQKTKPGNEKSVNLNPLKKSENKKIPAKESLINKKIAIKKIAIKKIAKKKIAISFKSLYRTFSLEQINSFSIDELKINASNFDLNPLLNFKLLSKLYEKDLKEYNKYIRKYKYTLNYEDAKKLGCFTDKENDEIKKCQKNFKIEIKEIKSLSKLKLFNFLFYLINLELNDANIPESDLIKKNNEIKEKILSYQSDVDLIFKIPNNFGNYELQYYTYLDLFIIYFYKKIEQKNDEDNNNSNNEPNEVDVFFNWDKKINGKYEDIDITQFEDNKNELSKLLFEKIIENEETDKKDIKKETTKVENQELKISTKPKFTITQNLYDFIQNQIPKLKMYKDELFFLFKEEDDKKILNQIEFIYYSLLFTTDNTYKLYDIYPYCLYNNPKIKNENFNIKFLALTTEQKRNTIKKEEIVFYNLDKYFEVKKDNPFCNKASYFKFPILLKKNIFQFNQNAIKLFRNFFKEIYKSKLLEEIYYLTPEFNDFKYPLSDDEILEEMLDNTIFLPFDHQILHGYTQKQFAKIYISAKFLKENYYKRDLSKVLIEISFMSNTLIHEQFKHYIKGLLFYNSFRFKENKRLDSDLSGYEQDKSFMDNIRLKYAIEKDISLKPVIDGGNRAEIYLYGYVLSRLFLSGALFLIDKKTWNLPVYKHLEQFNENNKSFPDKKQTIEDLKNNVNIIDFFKEIINQFINNYECDVKTNLNFKEYGSEKPNDNSMFIEENNEGYLDYSAYIETSKITIPDTETDKNLIDQFEQ